MPATSAIRLRPPLEAEAPIFVPRGQDPRFVKHAGWSPGLRGSELRTFCNR